MSYVNAERFVTERELEAHLGPINRQLDTHGDKLDRIISTLDERRGVSRFVRSAGGVVTLFALVVSAGWWIPALLH